MNPGADLVQSCSSTKLSLRITFLGEDLEPLNGIAVELRRVNGEVLGCRTNRSGETTFFQLDPGEYRLCAIQLDHAAWHLLGKRPLEEDVLNHGPAPEWIKYQTAPLGNGTLHAVQPLESIDMLAFRHGLAPQTLWEHPRNAALRELREKDLLYAGGEGAPPDEVFIPPIEIGECAVEAGFHYRFLRTGVPSLLRLRFMDEDTPRAGVPYLLRMFEAATGIARCREGHTDEVGFLTAYVDPDCTEAELILGKGAGREHYPLKIGALASASTLNGVLNRMQNLGICAEEASTLAVALQQIAQELSVSIDDLLDELVRDLQVAHLS